MNLSRWYRRWVQLYPNPFRAEYGAELLLLFEETWRDHRSGSKWDRTRLLAFVAYDAIRSLVKEWSAALGWPVKILIAGTAAMLGFDIANGVYSGVASAVYFFVSMAVTAAVIGAVRRRHFGVAVGATAATAVALYFGAEVLRWFAPVEGVQPRFGTASDLFGLAMIIYATGVRVSGKTSPTKPAVRQWFGQRPLLIFLSLLCVGFTVGGMVRAGVIHYSDNTAFYLLIGNILMSCFQTTWTSSNRTAT